MNYTVIIPTILSVIAIALAGRAWYITGRTKKYLDEYHRKRGDIPPSLTLLFPFVVIKFRIMDINALHR